MSGTRALDELLCFLGDIIFQVPVRTFMDNKCFIFDPSIEITAEHKRIHSEYKQLIDTLLESYCEDNDLTINDVLSGIKQMSDMPDIKEVFQVVFEQVWAANAFQIFVQVMCKRNLAIQELALKLLIQATGIAPEVFRAPQTQSSRTSQPTSVMQSEQNEEEELLRKALEESIKDAEMNKKKQGNEEADLKKTLELSKSEAVKVKEEQRSLERNMQKMLLDERLPPVSGMTGSNVPVFQPNTAASRQAVPAGRPSPAAQSFAAPAKSRSDAFGIAPKGGPSGAEAANSWLRSAMAESETSDTHKAVMAQMQKMTPDELKRRQEYLNEQREKLLKMKQQEREKQLSGAVKANPGRPQSARAAKAALANKGNAAEANQITSEEEQKRIAMRRAIADKLRMEVIGKP